MTNESDPLNELQLAAVWVLGTLVGASGSVLGEIATVRAALQFIRRAVDSPAFKKQKSRNQHTGQSEQAVWTNTDTGGERRRRWLFTTTGSSTDGIEGTVDEVADVIAEPLEMPRWWPAWCLDAEEVNRNPTGAGRRA